MSPIFTVDTKSKKCKIRLITGWFLNVSKGCFERMLFPEIIKSAFCALFTVR